MTMNWREINKALPGLTEAEVQKLLLAELDGNRRATIVIRLHQRFTVLRAARERRELLEDMLAADIEDANSAPVH